jgi:hypothetical protein
MSLQIAVLLAVVTIVVVVRWRRSRADGRMLPPGPTGLPILGSTLAVTNPHKKVWTVFEEWEHQFGKGLLTVKTLGRINIVIR